MTHLPEITPSTYEAYARETQRLCDAGFEFAYHAETGEQFIRRRADGGHETVFVELPE